MKNSCFKYTAVRLTYAFILAFGFQAFADLDDDANKWFSVESQKCYGADSYLPSTTLPDRTISPGGADTEKRRGCGVRLKQEAERKRKACDKKSTECKGVWTRVINDIISQFSLPDQNNADKNTQCENRYTDDQEIFTDCKTGGAKAAKCAKFNEKEETDFLSGETMQGMMPLLGMVNGASNLIGMYSAMSSNPGCTLSKEDFLNQKDKLDTQAKDIEEKIRELREKAEEAQEDYRKELETWSEREVEIADELAKIPVDLQEKKDKTIEEKTKLKMAADQEYAKVTNQIKETTRKISELIDAKKVALKSKSAFSIHDECAELAVNGDPKKDAANKQASTAVQANFANAFAQGRMISANIKKKYDNCVARETAVLQQTNNSFDRGLVALKEAIKDLQGDYGRIAENKRLADESLTKSIQSMELKANTDAAKLRNEYLNIQQKKQAAQANLKTKLERLNSDSKKQEQKLALLQMQLQQFQGKTPPTNSKGMSMSELASQCGEDYQNLIKDFKKTCCEDFQFKGSGNSVCRIKTEEEKAAAAEERKAKRSTKPRGAGQSQ